MSSTVLVIEDDHATSRLMKLQLGREGFSVLLAPNGFQGLKMARADSPDLILLDLMLPGMDGFEVLNRLRADSQTADVKVVIVSAKSRPADKDIAARIGADAYLVKPYEPQELIALVRSLVSERQEDAAAAPRGTCVALLAPQGAEAVSVALYVGLVLVDNGKMVTAVDFRPFSIAHSLLLGLPPRPEPASLAAPETASQLSDLTVGHSGGLRLLNNLEGSGEAGQFTADDVRAVLDALLHEQDFVLADVPLYPVDVLRQAVDYCARTLLVTRSDPASLGATRSALTVMQRAGLDTERLGIVLIGTPAPEEEHVTALGHTVLGALPAGAEPDAPAFHALAEWLLSQV
jgi:DNA-binding response OmpR family regulator